SALGPWASAPARPAGDPEPPPWRRTGPPRRQGPGDGTAVASGAEGRGAPGCAGRSLVLPGPAAGPVGRAPGPPSPPARAGRRARRAGAGPPSRGRRRGGWTGTGASAALSRGAPDLIGHHAGSDGRRR